MTTVNDPMPALLDSMTTTGEAIPNSAAIGIDKPSREPERWLLECVPVGDGPPMAINPKPAVISSTARA